MRDQVDFRESGTVDIPAVGLHRNVVLEQIARFGASVDAPSPLRLLRFQPPVHLSRTDPEQLPLDLRPQIEALANPGHPHRQQGLQSHRPGIARRLPHGDDHRLGFPAVAQPPLSLRPPRPLLRPWLAQQPDRIFSVVAGVGTKLTQDHLLGLSSCRPVSFVNRPQILPSPSVSQPCALLFSVLVGLHPKWRDVVSFGYILDGAIRGVAYRARSYYHRRRPT